MDLALPDVQAHSPQGLNPAEAHGDAVDLQLLSPWVQAAAAEVVAVRAGHLGQHLAPSRSAAAGASAVPLRVAFHYAEVNTS